MKKQKPKQEPKPKEPVVRSIRWLLVAEGPARPKTEYIVYAMTREQAETILTTAMGALTVVIGKRIGFVDEDGRVHMEDDPQAPIIDGAPPRETRSG